MLKHGPRGKRPRKRLQPDVAPRLPPPQRHARQLCDNVSEVRDALRPVSVFRGCTAALAHALVERIPETRGLLALQPALRRPGFHLRAYLAWR